MPCCGRDCEFSGRRYVGLVGSLVTDEPSAAKQSTAKTNDNDVLDNVRRSLTYAD